jgi:hypothetical protein
MAKASMLHSLTRRLTAPIRRPIAGLRSLMAAVDLAELGELAGSPRDLARFAHLQGSFFNFRYLFSVLTAREVGLFSALQDGPMSLAELARGCQIHPQAAHTLGRVLESQGLVSMEAERVWLSPFGSRYMTADGPASLLPVIDLLLTYARSFPQIIDGLRDGVTPKVLDVRNDGPTTDSILDSVNAHLAQAASELLERADIPSVQRFIVGSMGVSFSAELMRRQPSARVTYGCLDHLVERIPRLRREFCVDASRVDGMHCHTGEPSGDRWGQEAFDLVFLTRKMILAPEDAVGEKFARKALQVLEPGGVAIFWEAIHPQAGPSPLALSLETFFDLGMSPSAPLKTDTGFERTLRDIGFAEVDYVGCLGGSTTFAIARRAGG